MADAPRRCWVVRAGTGEEILDAVAERGLVAIGWRELGDCSALTAREQFRERFLEAYPDERDASRRSYVAGQAGQVYRFAREIQVGDTVLTPDRRSRELLVGKVAGTYRYLADFGNGSYPHVRDVAWRGRIARDSMSSAFRASTGNISTLFSVDAYCDEVEALLSASPVVEDVPGPGPLPEPYSFLETTRATADELIADLLARIPWAEFEQLVAAVLRALGFHTRLTARGADGGVDIVAHPDALGFDEPRITVQVKHVKNAVGSPDVRNFRATIAPGEKGLFVSTGGYTRDALQEPLRAGLPLVLMDRDDFVRVLLDNYDALEPEYKALIPLERVYIPSRI